MLAHEAVPSRDEAAGPPVATRPFARTAPEPGFPPTSLGIWVLELVLLPDLAGVAALLQALLVVVPAVALLSLLNNLVPTKRPVRRWKDKDNTDSDAAP